jgi:hypothetical protein
MVFQRVIPHQVYLELLVSEAYKQFYRHRIH